MTHSLVYYARNGVTFETSSRWDNAKTRSFPTRLSTYVYLQCFFTKLLTLLIYCRSNIVLSFFQFIFTCVICLNIEVIKGNFKDFFRRGRGRGLECLKNEMNYL